MFRVSGLVSTKRQKDWYFIAEQPAPAPHLAHPEGCAALRIVLVTVPPRGISSAGSPFRVPGYVFFFGLRDECWGLGFWGVRTKRQFERWISLEDFVIRFHVS